MAAVSDKTLGILLIVAIVISVGGAILNLTKLAELTQIVPLLQITGYPTAGTVNLTIQSAASINLSTFQVDFSAGYVSTGTAARLNTSSSGVLGRENWTNQTTFAPDNITVENVGNRNASVNFTSDKNGSEFVSANTTTTPIAEFMFRGVNKDAGSCAAANLTSAYTNISDPVTADDSNTVQNNLCKCMRFETANDEIYVNFHLLIPESAPVGGKNATLTFTASDWAGTNKIC